MTEETIERLVGAARLLVATDFDGVLAPIVSDPDDAAPLDGSMAALGALAAAPDTTVAIVSGRELAQLDHLVPEPERFVLVGSHGAEIGETLVSDEDRALLDETIAGLDELSQRIPGLRVEPKVLSVAVHVRQVQGPDRDRALAEIDDIRERWPAKVVTGKEVVELSVADATKGDAVIELKARTAATVAVYIGDDVTDEDAFAVLGPADVGVKVGQGETLASVRLDEPADVTRFLEALRTGRAG